MGIKLLVVDDHGVLRAGLRALLSQEADLEIVGEAADGEEAIRQAIRTRPDIVLMDITLPGINGLQATKEIVTRLPGVRVLMLTVHTDNGLAREALNFGASGYILKQAVESELINAIHAVGRGGLYIDPSITRRLLQSHPQVTPSLSYNEPITPRESEVLQLIARGYTNRQIGEKLCISVRTVESHRANIMEKLNLNSRVELVRYAREHDLLK
jgi:two-component system, NarL family, response regulator NreC